MADNDIGVTVSIDGPKEMQDEFRVYKSGSGSYDVLIPKVRELLKRHTSRPIGARVTLTKQTLDVKRIFTHLTEEIGFWEVGFAPVTTANGRDYAIEDDGFDDMLDQFRALAWDFLEASVENRHHGFSNVKDTLEEIHKGFSKAYPCGAGLGLMGVSTAGDVALCHRFAGSEEHTLGSVTEGIDRDLQRDFFDKHHISNKTDCHTCWARPLCAGGCYHEAHTRYGTTTGPNLHYCEWIRGWTDTCLQIYGELATRRNCGALSAGRARSVRLSPRVFLAGASARPTQPCRGLDRQVCGGAEGLAQVGPDLPVGDSVTRHSTCHPDASLHPGWRRDAPTGRRCGRNAAVLMVAIVALMIAPLVPAAPAAEQQSGGNATIFVAAYDNSVHVIDEATLQVVDKIATTTGIPRNLLLSHDRKRLYVLEVQAEIIEVLDIETRRSIDSFTLSEGDLRVRINGLVVHPDQTYALMTVQEYVNRTDRFEVSESKLLQYDLQNHAVMREIPWPDERPRRGAAMIFSPDGSHVYFFSRDILVLETEDFTEVDKWEISQPLEPGLGRFTPPLNASLYEEEGFFTGLFRMTDPVQGRRMMGIARVNLAARDVDFYMLGPNEPVGFSIAPDRTKAYGLYSSGIGKHEFWTFDLVNRGVASKQPFDGRPRMSLAVSSNGEQLYIYNAGNTIDAYDASTYRFIRRLELDADTTSNLLVLPPQD